MQRFDLIGAIRTYCTAQGYHFLCGSGQMQNYEVTQKNIKNGDIILYLDVNAEPLFTHNKISEVRYTGAFGVGIKLDNDGTMPTEEEPTVEFTDGTPANLDETFLQKYDKRLLSLSTTLANSLMSIACANELLIESMTMIYDINKFDENIDFVGAQISILQ